MSCYRICQADLTCTCIHIYSNNVQMCDERQKSANHTTQEQMRMCCAVFILVVYLYTFIYPCKYSCYPGFFLQVFCLLLRNFCFV